MRAWNRFKNSYLLYSFKHDLIAIISSVVLAILMKILDDKGPDKSKSGVYVVRRKSDAYMNLSYFVEVCKIGEIILSAEKIYEPLPYLCSVVVYDLLVL